MKRTLIPESWSTPPHSPSKCNKQRKLCPSNTPHTSTDPSLSSLSSMSNDPPANIPLPNGPLEGDPVYLHGSLSLRVPDLDSVLGPLISTPLHPNLGSIKGVMEREEEEGKEEIGRGQNGISKEEPPVDLDSLISRGLANSRYESHPPRVDAVLYQCPIPSNLSANRATRPERAEKSGGEAREIAKMVEMSNNEEISNGCVGIWGGKQIFQISQNEQAQMEEFLAFTTKMWNEGTNTTNERGALLKGGWYEEESAINIYMKHRGSLPRAKFEVLFPQIAVANPKELMRMNEEQIKQIVNATIKDIMGFRQDEKDALLVKLRYLLQITARYREMIAHKVPLEELREHFNLLQKHNCGIPTDIQLSLTKSMDFSKNIKKRFADKMSINELAELKDECSKFDIITIEIQQVNDFLERSYIWIAKAEETQGVHVVVKTLQNLVNEAKLIPVKFRLFPAIKSRYAKAHSCLTQLYNLMKTSKTRTGCIADKPHQIEIECILTTASELKVSNPDLQKYKELSESLREWENEVLMSFEDKTIEKSEEFLKRLLEESFKFKLQVELTIDLRKLISIKDWERRVDDILTDSQSTIHEITELVQEGNKHEYNQHLIDQLIQIVKKINTFQDNVNILFGLKNTKTIQEEGNHPIQEIIDIEEIMKLKEISKEFKFEIPEKVMLKQRLREVNLLREKTRDIFLSENKDLLSLDTIYVCMEEIKKSNIKAPEFEDFTKKITPTLNWISKVKKFLRKYLDNQNTTISSIYSNKKGKKGKWRNKLTEEKSIECSWGYKLNERDIRNNQEIQEDSTPINENSIASMESSCVPRRGQSLSPSKQQPFTDELIHFLDIVKKRIDKKLCSYKIMEEFLSEAEDLVTNTDIYEKLQLLSTKAQRWEEEGQKYMEKFRRNEEGDASGILPIGLEEHLILYEKQPVRRGTIEGLIEICEIYKWTTKAETAISTKNTKIHQIEVLIRESNNFRFLQNSHIYIIDKLKNKIRGAKSWLLEYNEVVQDFESEKIGISLDMLKRLIFSGEAVGCKMRELDTLSEYEESVRGWTARAAYVLANKVHLNIISQIINDAQDFEDDLQLNELNLLKALYNVATKWKNLATNLLKIRQLTLLYFKRKAFSPIIITLEKCGGKAKPKLGNALKLNKTEAHLGSTQDYTGSNAVETPTSELFNRETTNKHDNYEYKIVNICPKNLPKISSYTRIKERRANKETIYERMGEAHNIENIDSYKGELNTDRNLFALPGSKEAGPMRPGLIPISAQTLAGANELSDRLLESGLFDDQLSVNSQMEIVKLGSDNLLFNSRKYSTISKDEDEHVKIPTPTPLIDQDQQTHILKNSTFNPPLPEPDLNMEIHNLLDKRRTHEGGNGKQYQSIYIKNTHRGGNPNKLYIENNIRKRNKKVKESWELLGNVEENIKIGSHEFNNLGESERYEIVKRGYKLLEENSGEKWCICRRADDGIAFMIACDICNEWFHDTCLKMDKKPNISNEHFICPACSLRKGIQPQNMGLVRVKRISYAKFCEILWEGGRIPVIMHEYGALLETKGRVENWVQRCREEINKGFMLNLLDGEIKNRRGPNHKKFLNQDILMKLFLEGEGFPVEMEESRQIMEILIQRDWAYEALKCINGKANDRAGKKLLKNATQIDFQRSPGMLQIFKKLQAMNDISFQISNELDSLIQNNGTRDQFAKLISRADKFQVHGEKFESIRKVIREFDTIKSRIHQSIGRKDVELDELEALQKEFEYQKLSIKDPLLAEIQTLTKEAKELTEYGYQYLRLNNESALLELFEQLKRFPCQLPITEVIYNHLIKLNKMNPSAPINQEEYEHLLEDNMGP